MEKATLVLEYLTVLLTAPPLLSIVAVVFMFKFAEDVLLAAPAVHLHTRYAHLDGVEVVGQCFGGGEMRSASPNVQRVRTARHARSFSIVFKSFQAGCMAGLVAQISILAAL